MRDCPVADGAMNAETTNMMATMKIVVVDPDSRTGLWWSEVRIEHDIDETSTGKLEPPREFAAEAN